MQRNKLSAHEKKHIVDASHITAKILQRKKGTGRYIVQKELSRGAMGVINVVQDQDLKRISAMKVITTQYIDMSKRYQAFIDEARLTAQLEHPNIVPIHHLGVITDTGSPFYTMKLVEGEPLNEIIHKISAGNPDYVQKYNRHLILNIFRSVCNAVAYAHSRGIIHRDIKPENIMVGQFGEVLLMDWGLAKPVGTKNDLYPSHEPDASERKEQDMLKTQDGMIKGSPAYIAPEQAYGDITDIDFRTDIFLLGSTLYHMFTHHPPYQGENIMEIISKAERCDYAPPSKRNPNTELPLALEGIILKAMAPLKENRYGAVEELIEDIDAFIAGRRVCGRQVFSPGEHLMHAGDEARESYIIISGSVEVYRVTNEKKVTIARLGSGEIIGEMAGISHDVRSASVAALETTDTLVITYELMKEELQKLPPWMEHIVFSMAERIRSLNERMEPLKNTGVFPIINQLHHIASSTLDNKLVNAELSFDFKDIVDEISFNLGIDSTGVQKILTTLRTSGLCSLNKNNEFGVRNLEDFGLFVDYVRYKLTVKGGTKEIKEIRLTPEKAALFKKLTKKLNDLFDSEIGTRTSLTSL